MLGSIGLPCLVLADDHCGRGKALDFEVEKGVLAHPPELRSAPTPGSRDDDHEEVFTEIGCEVLLM
jgi:hypothetical protein